jgi:predicted secreted hydrolase
MVRWPRLWAILAAILPLIGARAGDASPPLADGPSDGPAVQAGVPLRFPSDHGAHPQFRTEWWYITGRLLTEDHRDLGFQVTFFRTRPAADDGNPSRFAPKQILFAHVALSDPAIGRLLHDQRAARAGFGLAEASVADTDIVLDDWSLKRAAEGTFTAQMAGDGVSLDLDLAPTQPVLLQGDNGYSRKGPGPNEASYYFSLPHLRVSGKITEGGAPAHVTGEAWLDREWSTTLLDPGAVGWDWLGVNLDDGGALTVFQIRDAAGRPIWAGGSWRAADGGMTRLGPQDVRFDTERVWRSPRTGTDYPVERRVTVKLADGERQFRVKPLFDDQELDSRQGGGPVYWEGAVQVEDGGADGGQGYLELTGYFEKLKL